MVVFRAEPAWKFISSFRLEPHEPAPGTSRASLSLPLDSSRTGSRRRVTNDDLSTINMFTAWTLQGWMNTCNTWAAEPPSD
jgi:hypothetical protein